MKEAISLLPLYTNSVLQCVAACCSVLQLNLWRIHVPHPADTGAVCCGVLQCVAVCCSVLQCVAVCCSVLWQYPVSSIVCCSVLQCFAVCCGVLRCVAVY